MTVNVKIGAQLDPDIGRRVDELTRKINGMGKSIASTHGVQFNPIDKASVEMLQRVERTLRNIRQLAPEIARHLKGSGQEGTPLLDVDWGKAYANAHARKRAQRGVFEMATGLGFIDAPAPPAPPPKPPAVPPPPPNRPPGSGRPAGPQPPSVGQTAGDVFRQGLQAAGPLGGVAATGLRAGAAGGFGAGVMGAAGAMGAFALSSLIGAVRQEIGAAQQESIVYDTLRNQLGGTGSGIGFNRLRDRLRASSFETATTYEETQALAGLFARRGNSNSLGIADDVTQAGGFARSFGFDPSSGVAAFASMRGMGITSNAEEGRRLGLMIAEGIAHGGVFAKAEEFLAEIAGFSEQQTRSSLSRANVEGYTGALAGLLAMRQPGLDVSGAANLLSRANSAIERGGAAGEAGQSFMWSTVGRRLGLDPLMATMLQEGGMFATGRNTFGAGTALGDSLRASGVSIPGRAAGSDTTVFQMVTEGLRSRYSNPVLRLNATANMFGLNMRQADALSRLQPAELNSIEGLLGADGIRTLSATGIQSLARIGRGGMPELNSIADEFAGRTGRDALTPAESRRLSEARTAALSGDSEAVQQLRRVLAEIAAGRQQEETEGGRTRRTVQDVEKAIRDMATAFVGPMNTARDALLVLAGRDGRALTAGEVRRRVLAGALAEVDESQRDQLAAVDGEIRTASEAHARAVGLANNNPGDEDLQRRAAEAQQRYEALQERRGQIITDHDARRQGVIRDGRAEARGAERVSQARRNAEAIAAGGGAGGEGDISRRERSDAQFREEFGPLAAQAAAQLGVPAETVLAHWSLETNNGRAFAGRNNLGNMTALASQPATPGADRDGAGNRITQRFRDFETREDFMRAYVSWVQRRASNAIGSSSATVYGRRLQAGGYATDPRFATSLGGVASRFNRLPTPPIPPEAAAGTPLPPGAPPNAVEDAGRPAAPPQRVSGNFEGVFVLQDPRGRELANPLRVQTAWGQPRPAGSFG
ncbi:hypothetical protein EOD42_22420 [Rhodovarius crocodyli]|uniref:Mannosyl-glycoprotein endo-beta-N-acetylglucosamidase-like domain-containing protein n=1 Tax=Rhodovarius crocodyli TaxID=1979269 RepID=A0A437M1J5_9PROT|nr:glucosaminidase domain-containing protein [Rhodovarius crocodyli]RVT91413.1 hypothetical protein EOD42_22420 [Rhodovarius crocodyli]